MNRREPKASGDRRRGGGVPNAAAALGCRWAPAAK